MKKIPIQEAKKLAQELGYDMIIIIGVNENLSGHVTTYGKTKHWCKVAGHIGQEILAPEVFGKDGKVLNMDWQELFSKGEDYNSKNDIKKFEETEEGREEFIPIPGCPKCFMIDSKKTGDSGDYICNHCKHIFSITLPKSEETAPCMQCGKDTGIVPEMCCSGSTTMECGCMGQPVNGPFFCSNECYDKYINEDRHEEYNKEVHPTDIKNGCPRCGGDLFDGTSTGWMMCNKCNYMI